MHNDTIKDLQLCTSEDMVKKFFIKNGIEENDYKQKIELLTEACCSDNIKFFNKDISDEKKYRSILKMFLNEEFRFYRGI
ncbi:hypothetical protein [uncultured Brachyspira sp.]|uniref:hypothetical protein n=1 Tax=uncultured Brachyspira sp. TaxID=221953 RepID=UPI0025ED19A3|nr:hypothetical protein [uncultured Brachyspira sp.]